MVVMIMISEKSDLIMLVGQLADWLLDGSVCVFTFANKFIHQSETNSDCFISDYSFFILIFIVSLQLIDYGDNYA